MLLIPGARCLRCGTGLRNQHTAFASTWLAARLVMKVFTDIVRKMGIDFAPGHELGAPCRVREFFCLVLVGERDSRQHGRA